MKHATTHIAIFFLFSIFSFVSKAQDSVSVLFIGNSYTYYNSLPTLLNNIAVSLGDEVFFDTHTPGGATLANHSVNPVVYDKINDQPWDFVVLQAQSQEPSFSDAQVDANTLPYAVQLADSAYANNFCSEVLFYMTWGRENGDPQWGPISTFDGMNGRLRNAYMRFADSVQGSVSPVGSAWKYIRDLYPAINLYDTDGSHPSYEGSYLAACTFYASVFRKSPIGASFIGSLDPTTAEILQTAASLTVLDSLEQWNLRPISEHTQALFVGDRTTLPNGATQVIMTNLSTKATNYLWDFGDGTTSTDEHPTHDYANFCNPCTITLIAESPCDSDTLIEDLGFVGVDEFDQKIGMASFGNGLFELTSESPFVAISVRDASGKVIPKRIEMNNLTAKVDLSELSVGVYFVSILTKKGTSTVRLFR